MTEVFSSSDSRHQTNWLTEASQIKMNEIINLENDSNMVTTVKSPNVQSKKANNNVSNHQQNLIEANNEVENENEKSEWTTVKSKRSMSTKTLKSRPTPVQGSNENDTKLKVAEASIRQKIDMCWIFVSNLDPNTKESDIIDFLKAKNLHENCRCFKMTTKKDNIKSSFKLGIPTQMKNAVMESTIWPKGIMVNHFMNISRRPK